MAPQAYNWTCSVCSVTWTLNALGLAVSREEVGLVIGYPDCVNETYGCMSSHCLITAYKEYGYYAKQAWVTYDQAWALAGHYTGVINPMGMYHFMGVRGQDNANIWVANSAQSYHGVYDILDRERFNALGPVQVIYIEGRI
jgi:hypothetical protein